jgi:hypothetical protein
MLSLIPLLRSMTTQIPFSAACVRRRYAIDRCDVSCMSLADFDRDCTAKISSTSKQRRLPTMALLLQGEALPELTVYVSIVC